MEDNYAMHVVFRIIFALIIASIVLSVLFSALQGMFFMNIMSNGLWNIVGLFVLLWFVSWIFRWPTRRYWYEERILRRRYARGEISETQFKRMTKVLKDSEMPSRPRRK